MPNARPLRSFRHWRDEAGPLPECRFGRLTCRLNPRSGLPATRGPAAQTIMAHGEGRRRGEICERDGFECRDLLVGRLEGEATTRGADAAWRSLADSAAPVRVSAREEPFGQVLSALRRFVLEALALE